MSPLSIIKYIVERLQGTSYEPWVNALLFMLFFAAICAAISLLIGRGGRKLFVEAALATKEKLKGRGYAPEWERFRIRFEPYIEFVSSIYLALIGIYSGTLVGVAMVISRNNVPLWSYCIGTIWVLASFFYMRVNLESASWAYHNIKSRKPANPEGAALDTRQK